MASINTAISNALELHPDDIGDCIKSRWINELEGKIMREVMRKNNFKEYSFPEDGDKELIVKPPYDNLYELYLVAMSNFFSGNLNEYSASAILFEQAYAEFRKDYLRNNIPPAATLKFF